MAESEKARSSRRRGGPDADGDRGRYDDDRNDGRSRYSRGSERGAGREDDEVEEGGEPPSSSGRRGLERSSGGGGRLAGRLEMPEGMYYQHESAPDR